MTSETVRFAAAGPDMNHREPAYLELIRDTKQRLLRVYPGLAEGWHPYLLGGSGTAAVEAMITSCVRKGPVLVLENGYYSARLSEILDAYEIPFRVLQTGWLEPWNVELIGEEIGRFEAVIAVHNETTTGRENPISDLAAMCKARGVRCLIDATSSFGADPIDFKNLDALCASANKCLHGVPGVSFVLASDEFASTMPSSPTRGFYLSLPKYGGDDPPLTPPVPSIAALRQALIEMVPGMASERRATYLTRASFLRNELAARGFEFAIPPEDSSSSLVCATLPKGWSSGDWLSANRTHGYVLYGCKGELKERYFQVAVMGELTQNQLGNWTRVVDQLISEGEPTS